MQNDLGDALSRLERLREQGMLTDAEYQQQKRALTDLPQPATRLNWGEAWKEGREFGRGFRQGMLPWFVASVVIVFAIGGYFFSRAHSLAKQRGELVFRNESGENQRPAPPQTIPEQTAAESADDDHITAAQVSGAFTLEQKAAIADWTNLETDCRGSYDEGVTERSCRQRDAAMTRMIALGVCWGREDQSEAEYEVQVCAPGSIGYGESPQGSSAKAP